MCHIVSRIIIVDVVLYWLIFNSIMLVMIWILYTNTLNLSNALSVVCSLHF